MNHDMVHCLDYQKGKCPQYCYRAQLTEDLQGRTDLDGILFAWAHLQGGSRCVLDVPDQGLKQCPFCGCEMCAQKETRFRLPKPEDDPGTIIRRGGQMIVPVDIQIWEHPRNDCILAGFCIQDGKVEKWNRRARYE